MTGLAGVHLISYRIMPIDYLPRSKARLRAAFPRSEHDRARRPHRHVRP
jgi:hypothetical protein